MSYNSYTNFQLLLVQINFFKYKCIPELRQMIWAGESIITLYFDNVRLSWGKDIP
jgi:hypothetical protein